MGTIEIQHVNSNTCSGGRHLNMAVALCSSPRAAIIPLHIFLAAKLYFCLDLKV